MHWSSVIYELCYHIYDKPHLPVIPTGWPQDVVSDEGDVSAGDEGEGGTDEHSDKEKTLWNSGEKDKEDSHR